jgi:hypothetical protein
MTDVLNSVDPLYVVYIIICTFLVFVLNEVRKNIYKLANYNGKFYVTKTNLGKGKYLVSVDDEGKKTIKAKCLEENLNDGTVVYIEKVKGKYMINEYLSRIDPHSEEAKLFKPVGQQFKPSESVS